MPAYEICFTKLYGTLQLFSVNYHYSQYVIKPLSVQGVAGNIKGKKDALAVFTHEVLQHSTQSFVSSRSFYFFFISHEVLTRSIIHVV